MSSDNFEFERFKLIIDNLNQEINSYTPWVSRKEIAAWSAIAIFIGVMFSVIKHILTYDLNISLNCFESILVFLICSTIMIVFSFIIFLFIHSQYSSIYDKQALTKAIQFTIFKLVEIENDTFSLNKYINNVSELISAEYEKTKNAIRNPHKNHVIRILINFWIFRIFLKKDSKRLSTHETQEALLYSTIIFLNMIFLGSMMFYLGLYGSR